MQALEDEFRMDMFNLKPVGLSRLTVRVLPVCRARVHGVWVWVWVWCGSVTAAASRAAWAQEMFNTPTLLGVSSAIIPPPLDWKPWLWSCGFWMVHEGGSYVPPAGLEEFLGDVRDAGRRRVLCITFGSMALVGCAARLWRQGRTRCERSHVQEAPVHQVCDGGGGAVGVQGAHPHRLGAAAV